MQLTLTIDTAHGYEECARQVGEFAKRLNGATAAGPAKPAPAPTAAPAAPKAGASAAPAEPPKGKGGRPSKAEQEEKARKAAEAAQAAQAASADDGLGDLGEGDDGLGDIGGGEADPEVTFDQLLNAFKARAAKDGRPVTTAIMQRFGAKSVSEIPQASWGLALKAVEA